MSSQRSASFSIPEDLEAQIRELTRAPKVAWPTVMLLIVCILSTVTADILVLSGLMSIWLAALTNGITFYYLFSIQHDGVHRAISSNPRVNDWIGRIAIWTSVPYAAIEFFRWAHIRHHRFTGGKDDPDNWVHGVWWTLPFRWMTVDYSYFYVLLMKSDKTIKKQMPKAILNLFVGFFLLGLLCVNGYAWEVLMLWYVPGRIGALLNGYFFFWSPHEPHDTEQAHNMLRATTVRLGPAWLLSPVCQWQNYHLVHHVYPSTPFYNNGKVWTLLAPVWKQHELALQHGFGSKAVIYPAGTAPIGD